MRTFKNTAAQGDVTFRRVDLANYNIAKLTKVAPEGDELIITHSETGHHHVMERKAATLYNLPNSIMECLLIVDRPTELRHLREYDTHEPILFDVGAYIVKRQREYVPGSFRRVED